MYTTLEILKSGDACVPGFTRLASFFGISAEMKEQRIPLHVVALVGGHSDAQWALDHAAVIDKEDFKNFYKRHVVAVIKYLFHNELEHRNGNRGTKNAILNELIREGYLIQTFEQAELWLEKARSYSFDHSLYYNVLNKDCWSNPHRFIHLCFNILTETYTHGEAVAFPEDLFMLPGNKSPYTTPLNPTMKADLNNSLPDDDEDDADPDEDDEWNERPRRAVAARRPKAKAEAQLLSRPRLQLKSPHRPAFTEWMKTYPHANAGSEIYLIRTTRKSATIGQNAAMMLCNGEDPYEFMSTMKYKVPKGVKVVAATETAPARLECAMNEPKQMFALLRTLSSKLELPDADQDN